MHAGLLALAAAKAFAASTVAITDIRPGNPLVTLVLAADHVFGSIQGYWPS